MSYILTILEGIYGDYPGIGGQGYEGGLDRPLYEPNPSKANPPRGLSSTPAPERSGEELYNLFKKHTGTTDEFYKGLSKGEIDNFEIHRTFKANPNFLGGLKGNTSQPSPTPPPPPSPPAKDNPDAGKMF